MLASTANGAATALPDEIKYQGDIGHIARLSDGRLVSIYTVGRDREDAIKSGPEQPAYIRYSKDNGLTWTDAVIAFAYKAGRGTVPLPVQSQGSPYILVDKKGTMHVFTLRFYPRPGSLVSPEAFGYTELLHNVSTDGGATWSVPRKIPTGQAYVSETMSIIQLKTGRIVIPLGYFTDNFINSRQEYERRITVIYSDDLGKTWLIGQDDIKTPLGPLIGHTGAMEPVVVELRDGRVWMIIRNQTFHFYESFSSDGGATWTTPTPTKIKMPNSPPAVLRMSDDSLVLCWNDVSSYPNGEFILSGRQYLHLARSTDDGNTWSKSKLIAQPLPGDSVNVHVRYPFLCEAADGNLLVRYHRVGTEGGRAKVGIAGTRTKPLLRITPEWIRGD